MIDAAAAKLQTRSKERIADCLRVVENAISLAIGKGRYECTVDISGKEYGNLVDIVAALLSAEYGYQVDRPVQKVMKQEMGRDGRSQTYADYTLHISWK